MDPKRKKIYIAIIVVCLLATVGIWVLKFPLAPQAPSDSGKPATELPEEQGSVAAPSAPTGTESYTAPSVFPSNHKLDTTVLNSSVFQSLQPYQPATIAPTVDLGRDDPFKIY